MITLTLEFPTADEFLAAMGRLSPIMPPAAASAEPAPAPAKIAKAPKAAPAPELSATPAAAPVAAPAPAAAAPAPAPAPAEIGYDAVAKAITEKIKTDRAGVVAALAKFGAKKGTELKADQFGAFIEALAA